MEYSDRYILSKTKSLSDKSKCNKDLYHNDIDSISSKLLNIKITQHLSSISHNFNMTYTECKEYILKNHNVDNDTPLRTYNVCNLVSKKFNNSNFIPDDCLNIIYQYSERGPLLYMIHDIIASWYQNFKKKIENIINENKFDISWYDIGSIDYTWAHDTINDCELKMNQVNCNIIDQYLNKIKNLKYKN